MKVKRLLTAKIDILPVDFMQRLHDSACTQYIEEDTIYYNFDSLNNKFSIVISVLLIAFCN